MKLGAEHEYLVAMIQAYVAGQKKESSAARTLTESDSFCWKRWLEAVCLHPRLLLPLGDLLYDSGAPWEIKAEFASHAKPMRDQTDRLMEELPRLQAIFDNAGIDVLSLKGPTIALKAYLDSQDRFSSDLDFLVSKADLRNACDLLKQHGYVVPELLRSESFYEQQHFHYIFQNEDSGIQIEIHWDLTEPDDVVRFELEGIRSRACKIGLPATDGEEPSSNVNRILAMSDVDMILHMVSQSSPGFVSAGRRLDIAMLVKRDRFDEKALAALASKQNVATPLSICLMLIESVCGVGVSAALMSSIRPSWLRRKCISQLPVRQRMISCPDQHTGLSRLLLLLCCPDWKTSIDKLIRIALPGEVELYKLGHKPNEISFWRRARITLDGIGSIGKMVLYMAWRILPFSDSR